MKPHKSFRHALNMVIHSKLRSWLTIIGIVIGVASVIAIIAIGDGMEAEMNNQMGDLGVDLVTVTPGASRAGKFGPGGGEDSGGTASSDILDKKDLQIIKGFSEVGYVDTRISGSVDAYYLGEEGSLSLTGVDQKVWKDINTDELDSGRLLDSADSNVIVIGYKLANEYFDDKIGINKIIYIEGTAFRVVGILEDGTGNSIYIPINSAYNVLEDSVKGEYDSIVIKIKSDVDPDVFVEELEEKLMISRHVNKDDKDFTVSSNAQMAEMRTEMMGTVTTFLTAIAAISLIVGSVGVANTMFTSVLEKTKQIGIMKAIGAKNSDIMSIFLFNAAIIGVIGGISGLIVGVLVSKLAGLALSIDAVISFGTIALAIGVSIFVGLLAGAIPAYQASQLSPVEALRSE